MEMTQKVDDAKIFEIAEFLYLEKWELFYENFIYFLGNKII
jgi:hypothetical protein